MVAGNVKYDSVVMYEGPIWIA